MLTRFISDDSYNTLDLEYPYDSNIKLDETPISVDGNLNYNLVPALCGVKDLRINNYTLNILSRSDHLKNFIDLDQENNVKNKICYIYQDLREKPNQYSKFWKFESNFVSISSNFENFNEKNVFELDILTDNKCRLSYKENDLIYFLTYSLTLSTVKFTPLTATNFENYNIDLNYLFDDKKIIFYIDSNIGIFSIKSQNEKLFISKTNTFLKENAFYIRTIDDIQKIENANNWVSYENTFNRNNINVSQTKSHFDVKNNYLFTSTINSFVSSIPINMLVLKNQLNQENEQSRGNVFLNENETTLKEYESLFLGGYRELGYDKINLGYSIHTQPYFFKSGKTTYFHVPHDIFPYDRLNINSSKLAECGAVGGNNPLNSDKIWKKLKDYKKTSPYSVPQEENTGQWLCTWLSAGKPTDRPIWMDRYYKPSKTTPFQALSAITSEIIYKDSFGCLDLKDDISDVKSSLTFEKGCYYAYMHFGKEDYYNLITASLSSKIKETHLDEYQKTNFSDLDSIGGEYEFNGESYGYIDSDKKFEYNIATFNFFAEKENWEEPSGNVIFGNYVNNGGFSFRNYILNTPYVVLKSNSTTIDILNSDFLKIDEITTGNISLCAIKGISRRNGFQNIHIITDDFHLFEMDLKGTIVDSNSAIKTKLNLENSDEIYSITNDKDYCYVSTSSGIAAIDLSNNEISTKSVHLSVGDITDTYNILANDNGKIYEIYGNNPIIRNDVIFYSSGNLIKTYYTASSSLSTFIQTNSAIDCYSVNKNKEIDIISKNKLSVYSERKIKSEIILESFAEYSLSAKQISYFEKFEYGKLIKTKLIYCENSKESYMIELDSSGTQTLKKFDKKYELVPSLSDVSNYNHNTQYYYNTYGENTYSFEVEILNKVNIEDQLNLHFIINSKDLSTGIHHFSFSVDCYNGVSNFYLDGLLYESKRFKEKKYTLSNTFNGRIFYGCDPYFNGIPTFKYFKEKSNFTYANLKISENYILNDVLDRFEILYFYNQKFPPNDLKYDMPCGKRSFIDNIEKTFNFNAPMFKSNYFGINIINSGIKYEDIKEDMERYIMEKVSEYLPIYTKLQKFEWLDSISTPLIIEGDYNISNTLTNIQ
jgi:hypothetical protein